MTEAHGLVERYGENKIVEVTAFTSRPGILTGLPGPNTTTATGPSRGIPPPFTDQARASFGSRPCWWWLRLAAGLLLVADGLLGGGRPPHWRAGGQPRMAASRTDWRVTARQRQPSRQNEAASTSQDTRAAGGSVPRRRTQRQTPTMVLGVRFAGGGHHAGSDSQVVGLAARLRGGDQHGRRFPRRTYGRSVVRRSGDRRAAGPAGLRIVEPRRIRPHAPSASGRRPCPRRPDARRVVQQPA
jgi:hypothetical protein